MRTGSVTRYFCILRVAFLLCSSHRSSSFNSWSLVFFRNSAACRTLKGERSASNAASPSQVLLCKGYLTHYKKYFITWKHDVCIFSPQKLSWNCPCCRKICPWLFRRKELKACCPCRRLSTHVLLLSSQDSQHSRRMLPMTVNNSVWFFFSISG